jgi:hypothetical protein
MYAICLQYPQNLLRNIARDHCNSEWVTCVDIDMMFPSPINGYHLIAGNLELFLLSEDAKNCSKCAFVLPTYEIRQNVTKIPNSKAELMQYIHEGKARRYHQVTNEAGQNMTNLAEWEKRPVGDFVKIAYPVKYFQFKYEPIYIARIGTPKFDERYVGYGTARLEQVWLVLSQFFHFIFNHTY